MFTSNFLIVTVFTTICLFSNVQSEQYTPIVMWHGMGDSCCFPFSLGAVKKSLEELLPGVYVRSVQLGSSLVEDVENGYFMHPDKQVQKVCEMLASDPQLANGYNAIGFSQGAQFLRAIAQRCPSPQMKNLISLGGQHQGVYGLPNCGSLSHPACNYIRKLLNYAAYLSWVQHFLTQATYWHDPLNEVKYIDGSTFLADINNEKTINKTYVTNLLKLENLVLVRFDNDSIVQPVDTEWFGFYKPGQDKETQTLQESDIYQKDRLGLRQMENSGKLHFLASPGNHLQFSWPWFTENIVNVFLKPKPENNEYDTKF